MWAWLLGKHGLLQSGLIDMFSVAFLDYGVCSQREGLLQTAVGALPLTTTLPCRHASCRISKVVAISTRCSSCAHTGGGHCFSCSQRGVALDQLAVLLAQVSARPFSPRKSCPFPARAQQIRLFGTSTGHGKIFFLADVFLCTYYIQLEHEMCWGRTGG